MSSSSVPPPADSSLDQLNANLEEARIEGEEVEEQEQEMAPTKEYTVRSICTHAI